MPRNLTALLAAVACLDVARASSSSPVQKVVELMNDMLVKAKQEKQDEKVRFAAFQQFCGSAEVERKRAIARGQASQEQHEADIEKAEADVMQLAKEVSALDANVGAWGADKAASAKNREEEHRLYLAQHSDYIASIESVDAAVRTVQAEGTGQSALVQLAKAKKRLPAKARQELASFLQGVDPLTAMLQDAAAWGTPEAAVYKSHSGGILETAQGLGDKFQTEKHDLEQRETNAAQAYQLMAANLDNQIAFGKKEIEMKASVKAEREQALAESRGALVDTTKALKADAAFLSDLGSECKLKARDFEKRQIMRKGEIEAITKAMGIMTSDAVALVGTKQGRSLAQLRQSSHADHGPMQEAVVRFLSVKAQTSGSRMLSLIAEKVSQDPFDKVTKMIQGMIEKLLEEANEAATHKGFCASEMGTNKLTRDQKTQASDKLQADIQELTSDIQKSMQDAAETTKQIATIDTEVARATEERHAEKAKNHQTMEDTSLAKAATMNAMTILKEYYEAAGNQPNLPESKGSIKWDPKAMQILSKAKGGPSFTQQKVPGAPQMESGKYTGMGNGGIMGLLEVIDSDFATLLSDTESAEGEATRLHAKFLAESAQDRAVKEVELNHLKGVKVRKESDLAEAKRTLKSTLEELSAATDYYDKLKPSCVEQSMSYEDRAAARKEEIESLQEALKILDGNALA